MSFFFCQHQYIDMSLQYGKYQGKTFSEVAILDPRYLKWLHDQDPSLSEDIERVIDTSAVYIGFGKYKHYKLSEVLTLDPNYCELLLNNDFVKNKRQDIVDYIVCHSSLSSKQ